MLFKNVLLKPPAVYKFLSGFLKHRKGATEVESETESPTITTPLPFHRIDNVGKKIGKNGDWVSFDLFTRGDISTTVWLI